MSGAAWYDPSRLNDLERGRLTKHEAQLVRVDGVVMTQGDLYASLNVVELCRRGVYGRKAPAWGAYEADDDGGSWDVPALIAKCATVPTIDRTIPA